METLEFDHTIFSRPDAGDESLVVFFYMGVMKNEAKSLDAGRHIFDDVEFCKIIIPGDKNNVIDRPASPQDKRRFSKQYGLFKEGVKEEDQISGTRLKEWPFLSRAQCEELNYLNIKTVEQLADVRDDIVSRVPGLVTLKRNAQTWLGKSKSAAEAAKITKQLDDQAREIETLKAAIREAGEREQRRLEASTKA